MACLGLGRGHARMGADPHPLAPWQELRAERKGAVSDFWDGDQGRTLDGNRAAKGGPKLEGPGFVSSPRRARHVLRGAGLIPAPGPRYPSVS